VRHRFPSWIDFVVYPVLLATTAYLVVSYLWDPRPQIDPVGCALGSRGSAICVYYPVGYLGHGVTWIVIGGVLGALLAVALRRVGSARVGPKYQSRTLPA
jgi:hypothetical protein